jgi:hypothetical protein
LTEFARGLKDISQDPVVHESAFSIQHDRVLSQWKFSEPKHRQETRESIDLLEREIGKP